MLEGGEEVNVEKVVEEIKEMEESLKDFDRLSQFFLETYQLDDTFIQYLLSQQMNHGENDLERALGISERLLKSSIEIASLKKSKEEVRKMHFEANKKEQQDFAELSELRRMYSQTSEELKQATTEYEIIFEEGALFIEEIRNDFEPKKQKGDNRPAFNTQLTSPKVDKLTGYVKDLNKIKADVSELIAKNSLINSMPIHQRRAEKKVYIDGMTEVLRTRKVEDEDAHQLDEQNASELIRVYNNFKKDNTLFNQLVDWLTDNRILSQKESVEIQKKFYAKHNERIFGQVNNSFKKGRS